MDRVSRESRTNIKVYYIRNEEVTYYIPADDPN